MFLFTPFFNLVISHVRDTRHAHMICFCRSPHVARLRFLPRSVSFRVWRAPFPYPASRIPPCPGPARMFPISPRPPSRPSSALLRGRRLGALGAARTPGGVGGYITHLPVHGGLARLKGGGLEALSRPPRARGTRPRRRDSSPRSEGFRFKT